MKQWVKKLSYYSTGAVFILAGFLIGRADVSGWWMGAMDIIGFALLAIGGFFIKPEQP